MPQRRLKAIVLLMLSSLLILLYIKTGASSTRSSEFYTRTVAAMQERKDSAVHMAGSAGARVQDVIGQAGLSGQAKDGAEGARRRAKEALENAKTMAGEGVEKVGDGAGTVKEKAGGFAGAVKEKAVEGKEEVKDAAGAAKYGAEKARAKVEDLGYGAKKAGESVKGSAKDAVDGVKDAVHGPVGDGEKSVAGRKKMKDDSSASTLDEVKGGEGRAYDHATGAKEKIIKDVKDGADGVAKVGNTGKHVAEDQAKKAASKASGKVTGSDEDADEKTHGPETKQDHEVEIAMDGILKKSPIIIFSKSYCPHSRKAKHILLDMYKIVPAPYVEELDLHPLGAELQAALQKMTGRRTVPNVLISGKSIGGGSETEELDIKGTLADKVRELGGKRIMEVTKV